MNHWKEFLSTGDHQYARPDKSTSCNIVVPWWEYDLAQKDQRIMVLKEELDRMISANDNANKRIAELEEQRDDGRRTVKECHELAAKHIADLEKQIPKMIRPKNGDCICGYAVQGFDQGYHKWRHNYCPECGSKLNWEEA